MNPISQADVELLQRFVDKFGELSCLRFFPATDPVAKEFGVGKNSEYDVEENWRPVRVTTDSSALDELYSKLPARLPKLFEHLLLNFRWAEVDLDLYTLSANPLGTDLTRWLAQASRDNFLWTFLLRSGYIPFGKGPTWTMTAFVSKRNPERRAMSAGS